MQFEIENPIPGQVCLIMISYDQIILIILKRERKVNSQVQVLY